MKIDLSLAASVILMAMIDGLGTVAAAGTLDGLSGTVDTTTKQSNVCPAHGLHMAKRQVEIQYGLPAFRNPQPDHQIREREFPFGVALYLGGCVVSSDSPKYALVYVCAQCELAAKKWVEIHTKR
ncbi:MAG TPA: hypothetical protein VGW39_01795 [Chthoniobacterales bacterium]|nr:hypothetical protein [Chthoniobacterales bacterium]